MALNEAFNGVGEITAQQIRRSIQSNDREQVFAGGENTSAQAFYENSGYSKTDEIMYRKRD